MLQNQGIPSCISARSHLLKRCTHQAVPKYYMDYTLETSSGIVSAVVEAIMYVTDRPQIRNTTVAAYAKTASALLHEIVDEFLTYSPDGPFCRRQSEDK